MGEKKRIGTARARPIVVAANQVQIIFSRRLPVTHQPVRRHCGRHARDGGNRASHERPRNTDTKLAHD